MTAAGSKYRSVLSNAEGASIWTMLKMYAVAVPSAIRVNMLKRSVRSDVQPRLMYAEEDWEEKGGQWICLRRDLFLADQVIVRARAGVTETDARNIAAYLETLHS